MTAIAPAGHWRQRQKRMHWCWHNRFVFCHISESRSTGMIARPQNQPSPAAVTIYHPSSNGMGARNCGRASRDVSGTGGMGGGAGPGAGASAAATRHAATTFTTCAVAVGLANGRHRHATPHIDRQPVQLRSLFRYAY